MKCLWWGPVKLNARREKPQVTPPDDANGRGVMIIRHFCNANAKNFVSNYFCLFSGVVKVVGQGLSEEWQRGVMG